jgi:small subunit ribosomal protein S1
MIASKKVSPVLDQILKSGGGNLGAPKEGDVVEAEVIRKTTREAYFDIGAFGTGLIYGLEFSNAKSIIKSLEIGQKIPAKVVRLDGERGFVELSLAEADKQQLWQQAKELQESGEIIKVKVTGANSGGLTVNLLNLKSFLPVSQLANDHQPKGVEGDKQKMIEELKKLVGEEINVKVIDVSPRNNKLIVSEREIASVNLKDLLGKYTIGQEIVGVVSGIADFGVFVRFADDPNIEGMIHISELSYRLIENPKEIVKIGETINVKISNIKDGRVLLSLKALQEDPWEKIDGKLKTGETVEGTIYKLNPFGAVVNLPGNIQGLIHISKFGSVDDMKKSLVVGSEHSFLIETLNPTERRIILDLKK